MSLERKLLVRPGKKFRLRDYDPDDTLGYKNDDPTQAALRNISNA